jgi:hypothetical protein
MNDGVAAMPFGGFWVVALRRQTKLAGYWSSGLVAWVPSALEADVTLWATAVAATDYVARNRARMISAQVKPPRR